MSLFVVAATHVLLPWLASAADAFTDFDAEIAPLLIKRCVECHQGNEPAGGLSLTTHEGLTTGGDSGAVVDLRTSRPVICLGE